MIWLVFDRGWIDLNGEILYWYCFTTSRAVNIRTFESPAAVDQMKVSGCARSTCTKTLEYAQNEWAKAAETPSRVRVPNLFRRTSREYRTTVYVVCRDAGSDAGAEMFKSTTAADRARHLDGTQKLSRARFSSTNCGSSEV